ncbi:MAG TPA: mechanosensitive ion channel family protein, partial [Phnomibacter sp.]|nr:mechanosensitive ion channel family protein [Phnomibacter sp.]
SIIIAVLLIRRLLSRWTAVVISRMVAGKNKPFNRQRFQHHVIEPIQFFLLVLAVMVAAERLTYPKVLQIDLYKTNLHALIEAIARGVLIWSFIWLCHRIIQYVAEILHEKAQLTDDRTDDQFVIFFRDFLRVLVWIVGILLIIKYSLGYKLSNVLTALSIVGAALALAFRESLENLIASFIIFFDKPFTVGDLVKVESVTGTIEKIGLRSTRLRTTEKTFTTVPNKKMVDTIIDNQTLRLQRNVFTRLELSLKANPKQIEKLITQIDELLTQQEHVLDWNVYFGDTGQQAHVVQVEYFVTMSLPIKQFFKLRQSINLAMLTMLAERGLELAAANTDVVVHRGEE